MLTHNLHFYSHWARQRIGEMDAAIASLQRYAKRFPAGRESTRLTATLKKRRDRFESLAKKLTRMGAAAGERSKTKLDSQWETFEAEVSAFVKNAKRRSGFQKSAFSRIAAAQSKAWKDAERSLCALARKIAPARRSRVSAAIKRIRSDASTARKRARKLGRSAVFGWSAMRSALKTSRKAFDKANHQAVRAIRKSLR